ncbi:MAG: hypothetical protein K2M91_05690 [Lachnospiraceae bacterium]|nr:hypothetical protein [Lachnospiraceae bacterium]
MEDGKITAVRDNGNSTDIVVRVNNAHLAAVVMDKKVTDVTLQLVDGRTLSPDQRRKIYNRKICLCRMHHTIAH